MTKKINKKKIIRKLLKTTNMTAVQGKNKTKQNKDDENEPAIGKSVK